MRRERKKRGGRGGKKRDGREGMKRRGKGIAGKENLWVASIREISNARDT